MDDPRVSSQRRFLLMRIRKQMEQITSATSRLDVQFDIQSKISTIQAFLKDLEDLTMQSIGSSGEQQAMDEFVGLESEFDEVLQNFEDMKRAETTNPTVHNQGESRFTGHPMSSHGSSHQKQGLQERSTVSGACSTSHKSQGNPDMRFPRGVTNIPAAHWNEENQRQGYQDKEPGDGRASGSESLERGHTTTSKPIRAKKSNQSGSSRDALIDFITSLEEIVEVKEAEADGASEEVAKKVFKLEPELKTRNVSNKTEKFVVKSDDPGHVDKDTITIMLGGETGAGKSTMINCLINYIFGVRFADAFRLKLILEANEMERRGFGGGSTAASMTTWVSGYEIQWREGFKVNSNILIIDVPGFKDTRGKNQDKQTIAQIKSYLSGSDTKVEKLSALIIVVKSSETRLSDDIQEVFRQILAMYAKDVQEALFLFFTFASKGKPKALATVAADGLGFLINKYYKFDNDVLYASDSDLEYLWKMNNQSFDKFFEFVQHIAVDLKSTEKLHEDNAKLERSQDALKRQIREIIGNMGKLDTEITNMQKLTDNPKPETYQQTVTETRDDLKVTSYYNMNCNECSITCHESCKDTWLLGKIFRTCEAFREGNCQNCPSRCSTYSHELEKIVKKKVQVKKVQTLKDLKAKFANNKRASLLDMLKEAASIYLKDKRELITLLDEAIRVDEKIRITALRPEHPSISECLQSMIEDQMKVSGENSHEVEVYKQWKRSVDNSVKKSKSISCYVPTFDIETSIEEFLHKKGVPFSMKK